MSDGQEPRRLTIDDPVSPEALKQLAALHNARADICERNTQLDQEKISLLAALKRLDEQKQNLFEALLMERGLAPDTEVAINPRTGKVQLLRRKAENATEAAQDKAPEENEQAPEAVHATS